MNGGCPPGSPQAVMKQLQEAGIPVSALGTESSCGALRINIAGNKIGTVVTPEGITPLERLFRRFPVEGTLTATPSNPFTFELGAIAVPENMSLVLIDVRWAIHVPSGLAVGDTRELEDRRLSTVLGYDLRFTDARKANMSFELFPSNPVPATDTFAGGSNAGSIPGDGISGVPASLFARLRAQQINSADSGLSTLPQRHRRDSQLDMPFTYLLNQNTRANFDVKVFRPIPIPIAFFEVEASGFFVAQNAIKEFISSVKPCVHTGSV